jgi:ubiquinone/menaquinone biosynthesis C-methylase UbiE
MSQQSDGKAYRGSPAENYQRYFVPAIGAPVAEDLMEAAAVRPGERVLDLACGTGVVSRLAAERVGKTGQVAGLDVHGGMLDVARAHTPQSVSIEWHEASAEDMPLPDGAFDVVLCQMGLQFIPDKAAALREMRRVLAPGGRMLLNVPGPMPRLFSIVEEELSRHIHPDAGAFARAVFSLHDADQLKELVRNAGFRTADASCTVKALALPAPADFLWQYVHSTPLAGVIANAADAQRAALGKSICERWNEFVENGGMRLEVGMTIATGRI